MTKILEIVFTAAIMDVCKFPVEVLYKDLGYMKSR